MPVLTAGPCRHSPVFRGAVLVFFHAGRNYWLSSIFNVGMRCSREALKLQVCWLCSGGRWDAGIVGEKQFLRSWSERAQLLGPLVFEKVAAAIQTFPIPDSLVPAINLDQGKVGKRGVLKKS